MIILKSFVKCIEKMYTENYSTEISRLINEKVPGAYFSSASVDAALKVVMDLKNNFNIDYLITISPSVDAVENPQNVKIITMNEFHNIKNNVKFIFTAHELDYKLASIPITDGVKKILFTGLDNSKDAYRMFMQNISSLHDVYELLDDDESKQTFCGYLLAKVTNNLNYARFANTPQYICNGFAPQAGDILIDGGSCDGSTASRLRGYGCKVYSFEMDKENFKLASNLAKKNNFTVENLGLDSYNHKASYTHLANNIGGSHISNAGEEYTEIVTLDSYVARNKLPRVDFIKLDVEGAELDVLRGAAASIIRWKPKLAISAYHKLDDLWTLTNFIKSIRPDYDFAVRHYGTSREDAPYAISEELENLFDSFGLNVTAINHGELVLFGK